MVWFFTISPPHLFFSKRLALSTRFSAVLLFSGNLSSHQSFKSLNEIISFLQFFQVFAYYSSFFLIRPFSTDHGMNIVMFCTAYSICSWLHHFYISIAAQWCCLKSLHNGVAWNRRTMVLLEIAAQWCCLKSPHNGVAWNWLFGFISPIKCVVSRTGCQSMQSCLALWIRLIRTGVASFHQVLFQTNLNQDHPPPHQHD